MKKLLKIIILIYFFIPNYYVIAAQCKIVNDICVPTDDTYLSAPNGNTCSSLSPSRGKNVYQYCQYNVDKNGNRYIVGECDAYVVPYRCSKTEYMWLYGNIHDIKDFFNNGDADGNPKQMNDTFLNGTTNYKNEKLYFSFGYNNNSYDIDFYPNPGGSEKYPAGKNTIEASYNFQGDDYLNLTYYCNKTLGGCPTLGSTKYYNYKSSYVADDGMYCEYFDYNNQKLLDYHFYVYCPMGTDYCYTESQEFGLEDEAVVIYKKDNFNTITGIGNICPKLEKKSEDKNDELIYDTLAKRMLETYGGKWGDNAFEGTEKPDSTIITKYCNYPDMIMSDRKLTLRLEIKFKDAPTYKNIQSINILYYACGNAAITIDGEGGVNGQKIKEKLSSFGGSFQCPPYKDGNFTINDESKFGEQLLEDEMKPLTFESCSESGNTTPPRPNPGTNTNRPSGFVQCSDIDVNKIKACGCIPAEVADITSKLYFILRIVGPVLLLILGGFDMAKAVASQDESSIEKSKKKLVNKFIAAAAIFFVLTIMEFVVGIFAKNAEGILECIHILLDGYVI